MDGPASPLSGRGWLLQERLLASRTLHFGCEQLFWECRECRHPEGYAYQSLSAGDELWFRVGGDWEVNKLFLFPRGAEEVVDQVRSFCRYRSLGEVARDRRDAGAEARMRKEKTRQTPYHMA